MGLERFLYQKTKLSTVPHTIEIHKSLWRDWMSNYSVKDFLATGKIFNEPENYGDPQWASQIASYRYVVHPVPIERLKHYLQGYIYLRDGKDGRIEIQHEEPVIDSGQIEDVDD